MLKVEVINGKVFVETDMEVIIERPVTKNENINKSHTQSKSKKTRSSVDVNEILTRIRSI